MALVSVDWSNKLLTFDSSINVELAKGEIRTEEASEDGIVFDHIVEATGKESVGTGVTAMTVTLVNSYTFQFNTTGDYTSTSGNWVGSWNKLPVGSTFERDLSLAYAYVNTGGTGLTSAQSDTLDLIRQLTDELHKLQGLDATAPLTVTPTQRSAGTIDQTISGDGETTTTVQRN